jgi:hypothetical protein
VSLHKLWWRIGSALLLILFLLWPAYAADTTVTETQFRELLKRMEPRSPGHALMKPIYDAEEKGDYAKVVELCNGLLAKPLAQFDTPQYGIAIKSFAYQHRGRAREQLGQGFRAAVEDAEAASALGNLQATQDVIKVLIDDLSGKASIGNGYVNSPEKLEHYVRFAAPLGDPFSEALLGLGKVDDGMSEDERTFWWLLALFSDHVLEKDKRLDLFHQALERVGASRVDAIIARYGLTKTLRDDATLGIPGRGPLPTMFIESDLRGTFQLLFGVIRDDNPSPNAPTLRENWLFWRYLIDDLGYGAAYLLLPGERDLGDSRIRSRSKDAIMATLTPGDRVFARCGALSHITTVYKREQNPPTIYFADAAYEFWQKGQNACISSFRLVDGGNNRLLSAVSADEVKSILEGVITIRDASPRGMPATSDPRPAGGPSKIRAM